MRVTDRVSGKDALFYCLFCLFSDIFCVFEAFGREGEKD